MTEEATITIKETDEGLHLHFEGPEGALVTEVAKRMLALVDEDARRTGVPILERRERIEAVCTCTNHSNAYTSRVDNALHCSDCDRLVYE